ncbi:hypothetical protein L484_013214 [Morus notabilis]|uniref:Protein POLAR LOCALIZATION DURING ASYMMETRIC DIVISION AND REDISTRIBUTION n=1 Tax=Morus notabilis TaxID=981085 RepID=W9RPX8_9ROSA|nr:protein POLAR LOCALIZATION DURING ASYMMETRIC DIVISION AND REDISTRIBUTION isoform X2 [Morus notabilis]EXB86683.1 hypothetical protein L484_013214 [Morus notabilis]
MNRHNLFFKTPILAPSSSPENRRLRIADILTDDEEDHAGYGTLGDDDDGMSGVGERRRRERSPSFHCSSPRRIIARCFAALRPARERRISALRREKREELGEVSGHTTRLMNALNSRDSPVSGSESEDSGRCRNDASFNMGVACALLYLIGASKTEITKMVEVRKQMEILLRNFREELQNRNSGLKPIEIDDSVAYSTNHIRESSNSSTQISLQMNSARTTSYVVPESETTLECDDSFRRVVHEREQHLTGMDELEAELEAELELLELHVDTEHPLVLPQQQGLKGIMDTASSVSHSSSSTFGEVIDPQETAHILFEGHSEVPPIELERRLHELLEARQQERIHELEEALECAKQKLREKEWEVSWWKDTAKLMSQHVPQPSRIVSQHDPITF